MEKPLRARVSGYEKPGGAQRSAEKVEATEGILSAEEGGSPLKSARARKDYQSQFQGLFLENFFEICFLGSFRGVKTYFEQKRFLG